MAGELLGRHEPGRAEHGAGAGLDRIAAGRGGGAGRRRIVVGVVDRLGEPPVDHDGLAELADEDVGRLEIAVDHAAGVGVGDRLRGRDADLYTRAVDIVVSRLRRKLEPLDLIKTLRNAGYTFAGARR